MSRSTPVEGFIEPRVRDEFPGLSVHWVTVPGRPGRTPPPLVARLHELSSRQRGSTVVAMRTKPIPRAYRVFFRQIGLDPDVTRIPGEAAAVARLRQGGFRSADLVSDACLIALVETGVPVWALDAAAIAEGGPAIRTATAADSRRAAEAGEWLEPGNLVVASMDKVLMPLFGEPSRRHRIGRRTQRITLFAVAVDGVPRLAVEEALSICLEILV